MDRVSARYGAALYEMAAENGTLEQCVAQAERVRDALDDPLCRQVLTHPHISAVQKQIFVQKLFPGMLSDHMVSFLTLMIRKSRGGSLVPALREFINLGKRAMGRTEARVVSAVRLNEGQVLALNHLLDRKLGKQVALTFELDPSLIGGFCIYVDGRLVDGSVRGRLYDMKDSLVKGGGSL